jgi:imidazolonepropionase-like amidohydrolase
VPLLVLAGPVSAQTEAEPPTTYALVNARIVVAPGRVIDRGTVVMRDGRIQAASAGAQVPADAVVLDLSGRTVYAGLIDAASTVGVPSVLTRAGGAGGGGGPPQAQPGGFQQARPAPTTRAEVPSELRADRSAGDVFAPTEADLEALRSQGVTAVGLVFDGGLLPGQAAAALVGAGEPASLVLRSPVAQQVVFGRRRGGYPGTLMGAVAYVRQAYYDAQHALQVADAFKRNPASGPRPVHDAASQALQASLRGEIPAWIEASGRRDFMRAAEVARDVGLDSWVILGGQEAYLAIDDLKALNVPLIISVDFPEPRSETGRAFELHVAPAEGTDSAALQADTAAAKRLRGNAAQVAQAGLPFALSGRGLDNPNQLRERVLAAVEAGLPADEALRALTVTPAGLLGLGGALGTIEPGKLANLVVVQGDLFNKDGKIQHVFVEGRKFDVQQREPTARAARGAAARGERTESVAGEWTGSIEMAGSTMPITLTLSGTGTEVSGTLASEMGSMPVSGTVEGNELTLSGTFTAPGMNALAVSITGSIENDEIKGTMEVQGQAPSPFTARRRGPGTSDFAMRGGAR